MTSEEKKTFYIKTFVGTLVLMVLLSWPFSYYFHVYKDQWQAYPILIFCVTLYYVLFKILSAAHELLKEEIYKGKEE